jgi:hypothetical protein
MTGQLLTAIAGVVGGLITATIAAVATRVQVLPEVIDVSIILTFAGLGSLALSSYGALRRVNPDRIARLSLGGTLLGGAIGLLVFLIVLAIDVL